MSVFGRRETEAAVVPKRAFGNTGVRVSILTLGGYSVVGQDSGVLLDEALKRGIDSWEHSSFTEKAFGKHFRKYPGLRERIFLSGKTKSTVPAVMQEDLEKTLNDNATSVIDFFAIHAVDTIDVLTDDVRRWAEKVKQEGKIRYFGFCTHKRVDTCLAGAAQLGWIDGVQAFYNYRTQSVRSMEDAFQKCHEQGIGIFTVKSMGLCVLHEGELPNVPSAHARLQAQLAGDQLTFEQAKLRAIWQNPHLTSVCSLMPSAAIMHANAVAALDRRPFSAELAGLLADYAESTGRHFCRRCGTCENATAENIPVSAVMEALMYARGYGKRDLGALLFSRIPVELRSKMIVCDYSTAERLCPQKMPISQLMQDAFQELNG